MKFYKHFQKTDDDIKLSNSLYGIIPTRDTNIARKGNYIILPNIDAKILKKTLPYLNT